MTSTPIARIELDRLVAQELTRFDDEMRAVWERVRTEPVRWRCSSRDDSAAFWVIAESGERVIWLNEIEDGFDVSPFDTRGVIAEYRCDQLTLGQALMRMCGDQAIETRERSVGSSEPPKPLRGAGRIVRRQSTFWDLRSSAGFAARVHFNGKLEMRFAGEDYESIELADEHALLAHHREPWATVYVTQANVVPIAIVRSLADRVAAITGGWRGLEEYASREVIARIVAVGDGQVIRAPSSIARSAAALFQESGAEVSVFSERRPSESCRALVLGESFVVAREFRFESI